MISVLCQPNPDLNILKLHVFFFFFICMFFKRKINANFSGPINSRYSLRSHSAVKRCSTVKSI